MSYYLNKMSAYWDRLWGIERWVYGIKEYLVDRLICGLSDDFDYADPDRYIIRAEDDTSDCATSPMRTESKCMQLCGAIICCPFSVVFHLMICPCICCLMESKEMHREGLAEVIRKEEEEKKMMTNAYIGRLYSNSNYSTEIREQQITTFNNSLHHGRVLANFNARYH